MKKSMKKMSILLIWVGIFISSPMVQGLENGAVFGQGTIPCKKYLKASKNRRNDYIIWVQGYLTAYNAIAPDVTNVLEGKDFYWVMDKLEQLCKTMPDDYFNEAAVHLVGTLHPQGIRTAPPSQTPKRP
jgi:hypothetical protein